MFFSLKKVTRKIFTWTVIKIDPVQYGTNVVGSLKEKFLKGCPIKYSFQATIVGIIGSPYHVGDMVSEAHFVDQGAWPHREPVLTVT